MSATREYPEAAADSPLCILHGTDSFEAIGMPDGSRVMDCNSAVAAWKAQVGRHFPPQEREPEIVNWESLESDDSAHQSQPGLTFCACGELQRAM